MPCTRLKQLFEACKESKMPLGGLDVIRFICKQCNVKEVCPSERFEFDAQSTELVQIEGATQ